MLTLVDFTSFRPSSLRCDSRRLPASLRLHLPHPKAEDRRRSMPPDLRDLVTEDNLARGILPPRGNVGSLNIVKEFARIAVLSAEPLHGPSMGRSFAHGYEPQSFFRENGAHVWFVRLLAHLRLCREGERRSCKD